MAKGIRTKIRTVDCRICGTPFSTTATRKWYCSPQCCEKASKLRRAYDIPGRMRALCNAAKYRAKPKSVPFNITPEFVLKLWEDQDGKCALTGRKFDLSLSEEKNIAGKDTPSLDRVKPELGYTKGNVRLITYQANCAKGYYSDEDFFEMCRNALGRSH